ncbi:MAG: DUF350 domain-containing protein [Clostridia bacterium]|nr:DUF350 domain-containing protein [Clostridia bacterium]
MNINWIEILNTIIYGTIGLALMFITTFLFDLAVPYDFNKELKEKNVGAGFIMAGIYISVALIVSTVIK